MSTSTTQAQRLSALEAGMSQLGIAMSTSGKWENFGSDRIAQMAQLTDTVDVSVTELRRVGGIFSKAKDPVDGGFYPSVRTVDLMDISKWFHERATGGGEYFLLFFHPEHRENGPLLPAPLKVIIDGPSRKPPQIRERESEYSMDTNQQVNAIAKSFINTGSDPAIAYELARKMVAENPVAAAAMAQATKPARDEKEDKEDSMSNMMQMMLMRDLMADRRSVPANNHQIPSAELAELKAEVARLREEKLEARREAAEARHAAELREIKAQFTAALEGLKGDHHRREDPAATAAAMMGAMGNMFSSQSQTQAQAAQHQAQMVQAMIESQRGGSSDMVNAVMANMLQMMNHQLQVEQQRAQQPLVQMEAMTKMASMTGGLLSAMVEMQKSLSTDEPPWMGIARDLLLELPEVVKEMAAPSKTRVVEQQRPSQVLSRDEQLLLNAVSGARHLEEQADSIFQKRPPEDEEPIEPTEVAPPSSPSPSPSPSASASALSKEEEATRTVKALGMEVFVPLLKLDPWVDWFSLLQDTETSAEDLGSDFVKLLVQTQQELNQELPAALEDLIFKPLPILTALEKNLDWDKDSVKEFLTGLTKAKKELKLKKIS